jgi:hypothetical protein
VGLKSLKSRNLTNGYPNKNNNNKNNNNNNNNNKVKSKPLELRSRVKTDQLYGPPYIDDVVRTLVTICSSFTNMYACSMYRASH